MGLHRLPGCVFATQGDGGHYDCAYCQEHLLLHLYYGKERVASRSTLLIRKVANSFDTSRVAIDSRCEVVYVYPSAAVLQENLEARHHLFSLDSRLCCGASGSAKESFAG